MSSNEPRSKTTTLFWTILRYLSFVIYWAVVLLVFSFITNSMTRMEWKLIAVLALIFAAVTVALIIIIKKVKGED